MNVFFNFYEAICCVKVYRRGKDFKIGMTVSVIE